MPVASQDNSQNSVPDDRVLLRRFVQDADEAAFAEIVRRYQKLVMSVCGRILGYGADAEDAFQATFVCLARRPRSIRSSKALSSWLYTVAYRTSWRLVRGRRKISTESLEAEEPMSRTADPLHEISDAQDCAIVDEELNYLPAKHKDVLVMTYFANQTSQQIADTLNVSKGTIDGRLRDARNSLRVKLARRGVTMGAIVLASTACSEASAAVSSTVLNSTLQLGTQALANQAVLTPDLSRINHLIRPETTMMSTKLIAATILGIASVGALGFTGIVLAQQSGSANATATSLSGAIDASANAATETATGDSESVPVSVGTVQPPKKTSPTEDGDPFGSADDAVKKANSDPFGVTTTAGNGSTASGKTAQQAFSSIPQDASLTEQKIYDALEKQTVTLDLPGETPLSEVMSQLIAALNQYDQTANGFSVVVDHLALEDQGFLSLDDVFVKDIALTGIQLQKALKLVLEQTEIDYLIRDDVLFITTKDEVADNEDYYSTRIYPVKNLLALHVRTNGAAADMGMMGGYGMGMEEGMGMGMGGMSGGMGTMGGAGMDVGMGAGPMESDEGDEARQRNRKSRRKQQGGGGLQSLPAQFGGGSYGGGIMGMGSEGGYGSGSEHPLIDLVCNMTSPPCLWQDRDGSGGAISLAGNSLVIRQSKRGHEEIVKLLNLLANAESPRAK